MLRSSPGPKTGCSAPWRALDGRIRVVAILTRSEDRVQRDPVRHPLGGAQVAILTRSEDRVQHGQGGTLDDGQGELRSSPGPKTGCSLGLAERAFYRVALRSSPGPKTGCSIEAGKEPDIVAKLRSSPGPKTGCSSTQPYRTLARRALRSSPGPKTGCSPLRRRRDRLLAEVAILTRSEDRVQPRPPRRHATPPYRCDPHPVRRPGAATHTTTKPWSTSCCDPHPVRRPGAALPGPRGRRVGPGVAILTRSEDRVQPRSATRVRRPPESCDPHPVRRPGAA